MTNQAGLKVMEWNVMEWNVNDCYLICTISDMKIPDFSKHCILRGLLAVVPLDVLANTTSTCNSSLLMDIIFT